MKYSVRIYIALAIFVLLWCMGILAAPMLHHAGWTTGADMLYSTFSRVCHQDDARSFHIAGEKFGVCFRCSAIYFGFLFGLAALMAVLAFKRKFVPAAGFFFLIAAPMLADVALDAAGIHASTMLTRVLTGGLFGIALPWLIAPIFVDACLQIYSRRKNHSIDSGVLFYARKTK
jgi:uncharacterized membrane protein